VGAPVWELFPEKKELKKKKRKKQQKVFPGGESKGRRLRKLNVRLPLRRKNVRGW